MFLDGRYSDFFGGFVNFQYKDFDFNLHLLIKLEVTAIMNILDFCQRSEVTNLITINRHDNTSADLPRVDPFESTNMHFLIVI